MQTSCSINTWWGELPFSNNFNERIVLMRKNYYNVLCKLFMGRKRGPIMFSLFFSQVRDFFELEYIQVT